MLGRRPGADALRMLTPRERVVLAEVAAGRSNAGVAEALFLSQAAVEKHVTAIFRKLGMTAAAGRHRRVDAALLFVRQRDGRDS